MNVVGEDSAQSMQRDIDSGLAATYAEQYRIFSCAICGIPQSDNAPAVPQGGFTITHAGYKNNGLYSIQTTRRGAAVGGCAAGVADGVMHSVEVK